MVEDEMIVAQNLELRMKDEEFNVRDLIKTIEIALYKHKLNNAAVKTFM